MRKIYTGLRPKFGVQVAIHHDATGVLKELDKYFKMKPNSIGDPNFYLGAKLRPTKLPNGVVAWGLSASKYTQEAVMHQKWILARNSE